MDLVSNSELNIPFGSGTVAGILTSIDFVFEEIVAFSLGIALVGIVLWRLHARGRIEMRKKTLKNRLFTRETILLVLGILLALAVSFLELSFETINYVTNQLVEHPNCVRLDTFYEPSTVKVIRPPFHYAIDDWSLEVVQRIGCKEHGLRTLQFGGDRGIVLEDGEFSLGAPTCRPPDDPPHRLFPGLDIGRIPVQLLFLMNKRLGLALDTPRISILPQGVPLGVGRSRADGAWEVYDPLEPCEALGISSFPPRYYFDWDLKDVDDLHLGRALNWMTCKALDAQDLPPRIPDAVTASCLFNETNEFNFSYYALSTECIIATLGNAPTASGVVPDLSLFIAIDVEKGTDTGANFTYLPNTEWASRAAACPRVDVNVSFMLVSSDAIRNFMFGIHGYEYFRDNLPAGDSVLVPFAFEVVRGKCEQSLPSMGFSALLHTAYANWTNNSLASFDSHLLYQAYMLSMARSFYPFKVFRRQNYSDETALNETAECLLRHVKEGTAIETSWRLYVLTIIVVCCIVLIIVSVLFKLVFPGAAWEISPVELLEQLNPRYAALHRGEQCILDADESQKDRHQTGEEEEATETEAGINIEIINYSEQKGRSTIPRRNKELKYRIVPNRSTKENTGFS